MYEYYIETINNDSGRSLSEVREAILAEDQNRWLKFEIAPEEKVLQLLSVKDLTETDSPHAINILMMHILSQLEASQLFGDLRIIRGPVVVPAQNNFADLRFEPSNPGQSSTYTTWVDNKQILRTHTTALVSTALQTIPIESFINTTIALPGIVFRRDVIDAKHLPHFHQLDLWPVKHNSQGVYTEEDLLALVDEIFKAILPNSRPIIRRTEHPYTLNGIEVSTLIGDNEIEILEAGLTHPEILRAAGLDPSEFSGLALGMGLDRLVMVVKGMQDIRLLRDDDPRVSKQMLNLNPFKEVSKQLPITRDLSICIAQPMGEEDLHELIREAAGEKMGIIEKVEIISVTTYDELLQLNEKAVERHQMKPGQVNPLFRITFRHPSRPIDKKEANQLYQELYDQLHVNGAGYKIAAEYRSGN